METISTKGPRSSYQSVGFGRRSSKGRGWRMTGDGSSTAWLNKSNRQRIGRPLIAHQQWEPRVPLVVCWC